jgi:hypothetical protein
MHGDSQGVACTGRVMKARPCNPGSSFHLLLLKGTWGSAGKFTPEAKARGIVGANWTFELARSESSMVPIKSWHLRRRSPGGRSRGARNG